ncbi:MAG: hypothetical protein Q8755_02600, partial [Candidatus Phytoplasma australasiaticum]|nr:hypothetical protein [Candidatus Phytoplasma australasiaticum]
YCFHKPYRLFFINRYTFSSNIRFINARGPPPIGEKFLKIPDEADVPKYEATAPLVADPTDTVEAKACEASYSSLEKVDTDPKVSKGKEHVIVEDCDSSDEESDESEDESVVKTAEASESHSVPDENYILCEPETRQLKFPEGVNILYTMSGSDKLYSDREFPIKNMNQSLITKVYQESTSLFMGDKNSKQVVTQGATKSQAPTRKQSNNQQKQNSHPPQNHPHQKKIPAKPTAKGVSKFVKAQGTDHPLENKQNNIQPQQVKSLKKTEPNNQHTFQQDGPSTSKPSQRNQSLAPQESSKFVERRTCLV